MDEELDYSVLTEKQKRFIDYYIEKGNATEAAQLAGYSEKTAKEIGCQNLTKLNSYIKARLQEKDDKRIASQDEVLQYLTSVMRGEVKDTFDLDASIQDRTKCAELLGKRWGTFKDNVKIEGAIPVVISGDDDLED